MSLLVLAEAVAKPDHTRQLIQALEAGLPATRDAAGCLEIRAYLEEDGRTVVAVESWESKAHYERYLAWRRETGVLKALESLLEGPLRIRYFTDTGA